MATRIQEKPAVSPAGMTLNEPTFPDINGEAAARKGSTTINFPTSNDPTPAHISHHSPIQSEKTEEPSKEVKRTTETPRRLQERSATERPKPSTKHSLLRKDPAPRKQRPAPVQRQTTITFDHSSSDSDSSDDEHHPTKSTSRDETLQRQESQSRSHGRRRSSTMNPFARFKVSNEHFQTKGTVKGDGRLKLSILEEDHGSGYIAKALGAVLPKQGKGNEHQSVQSYNADSGNAEKIAPEEDEMEHDPSRRLKLNIVIIIIGSRGDIQPFMRIGKILKEDYGHRVRIATHPAFKDFVEKDSGLEFFSVGGNPAELMAFMVKNPGLIPNIDTIKGGEIGRRRSQMYEMFQGMWRACINATDDETDHLNAKMSKLLVSKFSSMRLTGSEVGDKAPFVADAIIANPPSFAPAHIAEKLGIPLHMMFTYALIYLCTQNLN